MSTTLPAAPQDGGARAGAVEALRRAAEDPDRRVQLLARHVLAAV